jgi:membrane protein DedA with SNARE-associated domain
MKTWLPAAGFFVSGMLTMNAVDFFLRSAEGITVIVSVVGALVFAATATRNHRQLVAKT